MRFFRKKDVHTENQEAEIQKIRQETLQYAKQASDNIGKVTKALSKTESIFWATPGGGKQLRKGKSK